eukprot:148441_1
MSLVPASIVLSFKSISKDEWIDDSKSNTCHICTDLIQPSFIKSNKHHCRFCAFIICSRCSQYKCNRKRICDECIHHGILQQIKQHTSKQFLYASIMQDNTIIYPAVFIKNQIIFYHIQNKKELKISITKTLKISEIFDIEYAQFESIKRSDIVTNNIKMYQIKLFSIHTWDSDVNLTFTDAQKRDEWYNALQSYISNIMEKERKIHWECARQKDYFKTTRGFMWKTQNKIKSINPRRSGYAHGSYILDCNFTKKAIWQFKIDTIHNNTTDSVIIGIDNLPDNSYELCFDSPTPFKSRKNLKTFALCNNGKRWINNEYDSCGKTFKCGDIVTMIYRKPNLQFYGNEYCMDVDELRLILSFWIRREHIINYADALCYLIFKFYFYKPLLTQFELNMEENKNIKYRLSVYLQFNAAITLNFFHQCKAEFLKQN